MQSEGTRAPGAQPVRILVVDADTAQTKALCDTLRKHGYETAGFAASKLALAALRNAKFDLLLAELMMPEMDGIALLQAARETDPDLVGIIMTAEGTIASAVEAMKAGALDYILKPFELSVMLPVLSRALAVRRSRMENAELERLKQQSQQEVLLATSALQQSEAQLQAFMNNTPSIMFTKDLEGRYLHINEQFARSFGLKPENILSRTDTQIFSPEQAAQFRANDAGVLASGKAIEVEGAAMYGDGMHTSLVCKFPILDISGRIVGLGGTVTDITARKWLEVSLKQNEEKLRTIADRLPALIAEADTREITRFANPAYEDWYGLRRDQIIGRPAREMLGEEAYAAAKPYMDRALNGESVAYEREMTRNGKHRHLHVSYIPLFSPERTVTGFLVLGTDVTAQKALEFQLRHTAQHDPLTGVPNRALFQDRLHQALMRARRESRSIAVLYLDIDKFKAINDIHGHRVGDELLIGFVDRIRQCVRATDTVARRGGDEFVVLLEGLTKPEDAIPIAEKIVNSMHVPFLLQGRPVHATISVGVATARGGNIDEESLIAKADAALYRAKANGRDTFHVDVLA